jgi:hypothetical protein
MNRVISLFTRSHSLRVNGVTGVNSRFFSSTASRSKPDIINHANGQQFIIDEYPAPGNPFHLAIPVHDMKLAREV